MNSRDRVACAINLEKPDRVPCNFHGTPLVCRRLFEYFGISDYLDLMEQLRVDMVDIRGLVDPRWQGPHPMIRQLSNGVKQNYLGWQTTIVETAFGDVEEHCGYIFADVNDVDEIISRQYSWPQASWFDFSHMSMELAKFREYAVIASGASVFQHAALVRGLDNLLADMLIAPDLAEFLMDQYTDFYVDYFDAMFGETRGQIDVLRIADDFGMQDRALISRSLFKEFVSPRISKLVDMAHSHDVKVMFHSCGSIVDFIDELVEIGVDILDPIQTRAKDMEPISLKGLCQGRICLHGSIDTQYTLPLGSPGDVEKEVQERISVFGTGGGFIVAPSHTIQPDVPVRNIVALYEAVEKIGDGGDG